MQQALGDLRVRTPGRGLTDITRELSGWLREQDVSDGLLTVFLRHTSASLVVQENADPDVLRDLNDFLGRLVEDGSRHYRHTTEGPDDMPAHIRSALTATQVAVPVRGGRMQLGTWQGVYVFEHRTRSHQRTLALHLIGE